MSTTYKERKEPSPQAVAADAMSSPSTKLPYSDQIQRAFGRHSIANVRARIGGSAKEATQKLGARGFAYGEDVVLGDSPDLHTVAHEAAHVIQQRGRAKFSGLGAAGDEHEQHAEQVAHRVERGESAEELLDQYSPGGEVTAPSAIQLFAGERPFTDYGAITKDPNWLARADAYEKRLGVHAYNHGLSTAILDRALAKMQRVLMDYHHVDGSDRDEKRKLYREAFTKDDASSAGQIGTQATLTAIMDMLGTGNLRERLTAFYNAAYFNNSGKGPADTPARGFKEIAKGILFNGDTHSAHDLHLEEQQLGDLAKFNDGWLRSGVRWMTAGVDLFRERGVSYNFADDPFALGNLALAHEYSGTGEIGTSQDGRKERSAPQKAARGQSAQQYQNQGMPLSARELAYARSKSPAVNANPMGATLPWVPGHAYWEMPQNARWVNSMRDQLRMPVIAGVSGTTTRMLSAFQWLNTGGDSLHFRLALIGWMLPVGDHSLYEILRGAQLAGVFNPDEGDLSDVVRMYMNVGPLATNELRANAGHNGMFPHEEIYDAKSRAGINTAGGFLGVDSTNNHAAIPARAGFTQAHATAIYAYTSGMHMIMNAILETKGMPQFAAHRLVKSKLLAVVDFEARLAQLLGKQATGPLSPVETAELKNLEDHEVETIEVLGSQLGTWIAFMGDHTKSADQIAVYRAGTVEPWINSQMPRIYEELVAHTNMAVEGLKVLDAAPPQVVWRGDWVNSLWGYSKGSTISIHVLRSFSKSRGTAEGFMSDGLLKKKVLMRVQTKANGAGRDIKRLSAIPGEDEILMLPGTSLVVTDVQEQPTYTLVHCTEQ